MTIDIRGYCVYAHLIQGSIIYIGSGSHARPYSFSRPDDWMQLVRDNNFALDVKILGKFLTRRSAFIFERKMIKKYRPTCNKMNNGFKLSDASKKKMSLSQLGHACTLETRMKISAANTGKKRDQDVIEKIRKSSTGRRHSKESIEKIRIGNTGRVLKEETKRKIGAANKGRVPSDVTLRKISASLLGRKFSIEHKRKIGEANHRRKLIRLIDRRISSSDPL